MIVERPVPRPMAHALFCAVLVAGHLAGARAERLPIHSYSIEDGLPDSGVQRIVTDSSGFLWFATTGGLARFDGREFDILDERHGLPHSTVHDVLESSKGEFWIATQGGLCRFRPESAGDRPPCETLRPDRGGASGIVRRLLEDRSGRLWVGTVDGLYLLDRGPDGDRLVPVDLGPPPEGQNRHLILSLLEDRRGSVWIGGVGDLLRIGAEGETTRVELQHENFHENFDVWDLFEDREGRLWVGTDRGLGLLEEDPTAGDWRLSRVFTAQDGLPEHTYSGSGPVAAVRALAQTPDGRVWAAATGGVSEYRPDQPGSQPSFRTYTKTNGLPGSLFTALAVDSRGNLWIGSDDRGVSRLARGGLVTFTEEDGLGANWISALFEDRSGALCAASEHGNVFINRFDGSRFIAVRPRVPKGLENRGWGWGQITFQDFRGEWWVPTDSGLCRYAAVDSFEELDDRLPLRHYTERDGLASYGVFRLFPDSHGDIWIGTLHYADPARSTLQRWDRATDRFEDYGGIEGVPPHSPTAFLELPSGELWIGFADGTVGRLREDRFLPLPKKDGYPAGRVEQLYLGENGAVWIVLSGGLLRVDDTGAASPEFVPYSEKDGLSSDWLRCIVDDDQGRIYVGTYRGIDRLDLQSGRFDRHYSVEQGLAHDHAVVARRDRSGALWFGTVDGLSRLVPGPEPPFGAPEVRIRSVHVAGEPLKIGALGQKTVTGPRLPSSRRNVQVEFSGLGLVTGGPLRFQYRLHGGADAWSAPTVDRAVNLASLAPGRYHFEVRAISAEGLASPEPAVVSFQILAPFWRRWWFTTLALILVATVAYAFHHLRLRRVVELERVRTRIAMDLHDDIGSSLSRVSILSEVVRRQVQGENPREAEPLLTQIADMARDLVDSMGDIVWAVNPKRDRTTDLVQRMRRFAGDTFTSRGIVLRFRAPERGQDRRLDLVLRRQIYLIFKEAVNNAVRHSGCTKAEVAFEVERDGLRLQVADDGRGFDPDSAGQGHGLQSMRRRAADVGGDLEVETSPGRGTAVKLRVPF